MNKKVCKNCYHYTGIQSHGHGEFWGECKILANVFDKLENYRKYYLDSDLDLFKCVCYDDTICKFYEILKDKKYEKK